MGQGDTGPDSRSNTPTPPRASLTQVRLRVSPHVRLLRGRTFTLACTFRMLEELQVGAPH